MTAFEFLKNWRKRRAIAWRLVCRRGGTVLLPRPGRASSMARPMPDDWQGLVLQGMVHDSPAERKCGTASEAWGMQVRHFELFVMGGKKW